MIIRAKAPFRLEFSGGGTDVPPFPDKYGGVIFNSTINNYAYCSITPRDDNQIRVHSLDFNIIARFKDKEDLKLDQGELDLVKAVFNRMIEFKDDKEWGMDVVLHSDIPAGSGLGSSSTVCVTLVAAIARFFRIVLTRDEIARLAYEIERIDMGIAGGLQDQWAAAYGGFNLMEFHKNLEVIVNPLKIPEEVKNELLYHLVLINTGKSRMSDGILRNQIGILEKEPEKVMDYYKNIKRIAIEMKNAIVKGNTREFGELLEQAWMNKKNISPKISNEKIELLYKTAKNNGAIGGRIMGAGGGGHMLFYIDDIVNRRPLIKALEAHGARYVPFAFDDAGVQTWVVKSSER